MESVSVTNELLMEKPKVIGKKLGREFKLTMGWLRRWKQRNTIKWKRNMAKEHRWMSQPPKQHYHYKR